MVDTYKTNNKQRRIRCIVKSERILPVYGVVIPSHIATRWLDTNVTVIESGTCIILQSGAVPQPMKKLQIRQTTKKIGTVII